MKRQDVSGQNTLHTDGSGSGSTDVNIASVGGTPVTSPLPVTGVITGNVTVVQPTGTNLHVVTDATSTTIATQATGTNLHTVVDSGTVTIGAGTALLGQVAASSETGTVYNGTTALTPKFAVISANGNGNNTIVGAVALKKIRVLTWNLMASGTVNAKWQSAAGGTDKTGLYYLIANTGISVPFAPTGQFETVAGELLNLNLSAGVAVGGSLVYVEV